MTVKALRRELSRLPGDAQTGVGKVTLKDGKAILEPAKTAPKKKEASDAERTSV